MYIPLYALIYTHNISQNNKHQYELIGYAGRYIIVMTIAWSNTIYYRAFIPLWRYSQNL